MGITDFHSWCEHYGYDPASEKAARDYREAQEAHAALMAAARKGVGND